MEQVNGHRGPVLEVRSLHAAYGAVPVLFGVTLQIAAGEKVALSLVKAFLLEPQLLLIDELSLGLSPIVVEALLAAVRDLNDQGTTVLLIEQSLNLAASVCERAILLEKGEVAYDGVTAE